MNSVAGGLARVSLAFGCAGIGLERAEGWVPQYTMMGEDVDGPARGVIPRLCEELFSKIEQARTSDVVSTFKAYV